LTGASGISAWLFVHPADVIKVRMQLMSGTSGVPPPSAFAAARGVIKADGVGGLYSGLTAGITRQAVYTTLRLGLFDKFKEARAGTGPQKRELTGLDRAGIGLAAGGIASFMTCPIEVCLVRMQADGRLPPAERRGYKHIGDALMRVAKEEGVRTYWRGATPTVARAMVVSMTQLGTYDQAKTMLTPVLGDSAANHLSSALIAAVVYSLASLPLDTAKTRMQAAAAGGPAVYRSTAQVQSAADD
ncbi:unnamed protein product, partial [Phaeothamnion confervicola]